MFPKRCTLLLLLLAAIPGLRAQEIVAGVDFATRFDNREFSGCLIAPSHTYFSARLTPRIGLRWDERNTLMLGVDLLQDFGDSDGFLTEAKPQIYYQYAAPRVVATAGIFDRSHLRGDYGEAFFDTAWAFYHNRIQGVMGRYAAPDGSFAEFALDWEGMQTETQRERFRILSAGRWELSRRFYAGYDLQLLHFAKTSAAENAPDGSYPDQGVVDNMTVDLHAGMRFTAFFDFDLRLTWLQTMQRDRRTDQGWKRPGGGCLDLSMSRWGLTLSNMLYVGDNLMPFWDIYGEQVYAASPFFGTPDQHTNLYNRTSLLYSRGFFRDTLSLRAGILFQYDGVSLGTSQLLELSVKLQKIFGRGRK